MLCRNCYTFPFEIDDVPNDESLASVDDTDVHCQLEMLVYTRNLRLSRMSCVRLLCKLSISVVDRVSVGEKQS